MEDSRPSLLEGTEPAEASTVEAIDGADTASVMAFDAVGVVVVASEEDSGSSETWS